MAARMLAGVGLVLASGGAAAFAASGVSGMGAPARRALHATGRRPSLVLKAPDAMSRGRGALLPTCSTPEGIDEYVDDGRPSPSDVARDASMEFWLELANQRLAGLRGGGETAADGAGTVAGAVDAVSPAASESPPRQPGEPFSEVEARLLVSAARERLDAAGLFREIDARTQRTLARILAAFREARVGPHLFGGTDGYGHGDQGRETLDEIYAKLFGAEAALVRVQCFSGTHAIACALFAVLRPGHELLAISGKPYDTLEEVIGSRKEDPELEPHGMTGSLDDFGVTYKEIDLLEGGDFDLDAIDVALTNPHTRLVHIQRSCGYQWRPSIPVHKIGAVIAHIKRARPDVVVFVDNCYGEFVEDQEPTHVGADLVAGSLIKNPGGTLAPSGGYIIGKAVYVKAARHRLSAPGVDGGATLGKTRLLYQGLFNAPMVVGEACKGAALVTEVFDGLGYETNPRQGELRTDIICAARLLSRENLLAFCEAVQLLSPVGSYIKPTPGMTVGYGDEVVFADGTFIDGSTLELSADGPLREPYVAFCQGGTHWTHWALVLEQALQGMTPKGER